MKTNPPTAFWIVLGWAVIGSALTAAERPSRLNVMYFGNSYLENSVPWFQPTLARSAGLELTVQTSIGPGWQIRMHVDSFYDGRQSWARGAIFAEGRDAVLIQHFGNPGLSQMAAYYFDGPGRAWQYPPRDVGDVAAAAHIIELFYSANPGGRAFIYNSWPGNPAVRVKAEAVARAEGARRKLTHEEMEPLRQEADFARHWLAEYRLDDPEKSANTHTRDYVRQLMDGLIERFPEAWAEGRLVLIPNGEVFYALDKKMRAGAVPGLTNVGQYSTDGGHIRAGLPRYTVAATCFAVMFQRHPGILDYSIYNDLEQYRNERIGGLPGIVGSHYVHWPDLGELLEITPERAKIVHDTIWEVVTGHAYTGFVP